MPVTQVHEPVSLEADHVYVIPPDRHLRISDNEISAHEFDNPPGQRAPIDLFFRSLAEQHGDGFAIILTGAGSDGAVGLKAVKEAGGIILVQDPNEAEYGSMPRSAIATGLADFVLRLSEIAPRLIELMRNKELARAAARRGRRMRTPYSRPRPRPYRSRLLAVQEIDSAATDRAPCPADEQRTAGGLFRVPPRQCGGGAGAVR